MCEGAGKLAASLTAHIMDFPPLKLPFQVCCCCYLLQAPTYVHTVVTLTSFDGATEPASQLDRAAFIFPHNQGRRTNELGSVNRRRRPDTGIMPWLAIGDLIVCSIVSVRPSVRPSVCVCR